MAVAKTQSATLRDTVPRRDGTELLATLDALRLAITIFDSAGGLEYANAHIGYLLPSLLPLEALHGMPFERLEQIAAAGGDIIAAPGTPFAEGYAARDITLRGGRIVEIKGRRAADGRRVMVWQDVTAERAQFARLREAVALSADAFAFFDANDRFLLGNELYARLASTTLEKLKGRSFEEIIRNAAGSGRVSLDLPLEDWVKRRMAGHRQPLHASTIHIGDGAAYLVRDRATPDGGRAVVFTDITGQRRAEAALAEQQDALAASRAQAEEQQNYLADLTRRLDQASAKADSAKTTLLRTMSHELKTPLNAILGFSDLMTAMAGRLSPEQVREYSALIHQGGSSLLKIINQIMDLTKISAGRYELRRIRLDAGSQLWLLKEEFEPRAAARGIAIDADACPIGLIVEADETAFTTMMQNLLDNAVTFGRPGGIIRLSATRESATIALRIADDGPGVAEADLERILEPFEQAAASGEHDKGAGLGLTLVKAFAELEGGRLSLISAPGEGFAATVTLPPAS